jgi:hypothetical protein
MGSESSAERVTKTSLKGLARLDWEEVVFFSLSEKVKFETRLQRGNRLQIPKRLDGSTN